MYICIYAAYCIHIQKCHIISKQFLLKGWWLPIPQKSVWCTHSFWVRCPAQGFPLWTGLCTGLGKTCILLTIYCVYVGVYTWREGWGLLLKCMYMWFCQFFLFFINLKNSAVNLTCVREFSELSINIIILFARCTCINNHFSLLSVQSLWDVIYTQTIQPQPEWSSPSFP